MPENINNEILGETHESVLKRLSSRNGSMDHTIQFERAPTAAESNRLFFLHVRNYLRSRDTFNDAIFLMMGVGIGRFVYHAKVESSYFSKIDNTIVAHSISPYYRFLKWSVTPMGSPLAMEMCGTFMPS